MAKRAKDPFATSPQFPMDARGRATYDTIAARLAALNPPIVIANHIAETDTPGKAKQFSTLRAYDSTLDGIDFIAVDAKALARELEQAADTWGDKALASMKEDPNHRPLKASFGATSGTGWREKWREAPYTSSTTAPDEPGQLDNLMGMRFGTAGNRVRFTALHCAVDEISGKSNIHIDEDGFILRLPFGFGLTANAYGHLVNEYFLKTKIRDWVTGSISNEEMRDFVRGAFRRTSLVFPTAANGFAGLERTINSVQRPTGVANGLWTAGRLLRPIGVTFDVYDSDLFKVQVTGSYVNGDRTIAISLGGEW